METPERPPASPHLSMGRQQCSPRTAAHTVLVSMDAWHEAGLGPAIHEIDFDTLPDSETRMTSDGWVYIMTNRPNSTLHVGTTTDLARRAWEQRTGSADGFTKRYALHRLVYAERYDNILSAKQRERNIQHWPRAWKVRLILRDNPNWDEFYERLVWMRGWPGQARLRGVRAVPARRGGGTTRRRTC
jgi:putative endonuclease